MKEGKVKVFLVVQLLFFFSPSSEPSEMWIYPVNLVALDFGVNLSKQFRLH